MRDEITKQNTYNRRTFVLGCLKFFLFGTILSRYFYLQAFQSEKYFKLSDDNRLKTSVIPAIRGAIQDRYGLDIVSSANNFKLIIDPFHIKNARDLIAATEKILGTSLGIDEEMLRKKLLRRAKNDNLILNDDLSWDEVAKISAHNHELIGVEILDSFTRKYHFGEAFASITGYIGIASTKELLDNQLHGFSDCKIGKAGLEKVFDSLLRGHDGLVKTEVDVKGSVIREIDRINPVIGNRLKTTIDLELQNHIHGIVQERGVSCAIIVLDAKNGDALSLYSSPTYNPNEFVDGISEEYWEQINLNANNPLINNTISDAYPPGSTFKLVTAAAILDAGVDPKKTVFCNGFYNIGNHVWKCWRWKLGGHGAVNLEDAICGSCNAYFYTMGQVAGIDRLMRIAREFGFGEKTGIELPYELSGLVPSVAWKKERFKQPWYRGDTVNSTIGQGYLLSTPLQVATMTLRIASGIKLSPHLISGTEDRGYSLGGILSEENFNIIRSGMARVVNDPKGTAFSQRVMIPSLIVAGKTGTSQVIGLNKKTSAYGHQHHALFTSFAPTDNPKYVVTVVVEHGEAGVKAAGVVKEIYNWLATNRTA